METTFPDANLPPTRTVATITITTPQPAERAMSAPDPTTEQHAVLRVIDTDGTVYWIAEDTTVDTVDLFGADVHVQRMVATPLTEAMPVLEYAHPTVTDPEGGDDHASGASDEGEGEG